MENRNNIEAEKTQAEALGDLIKSGLRYEKINPLKRIKRPKTKEAFPTTNHGVKSSSAKRKIASRSRKVNRARMNKKKKIRSGRKKK